MPAPQHPILAIDYGAARIGLAATDELALAVHPVETIHLSDTDPIARIITLAQQRRSKTIILGLPLLKDGSEGESAKKIRAFGKRLSEKLPDLPIIYHDEAFTTVAASQKLHQAGKNSKKQKNIIDQAAAMEILNDFLQW